MNITIKLDEFGQALSDVQMAGWIDTKLSSGQDIHISNILALDHARLWLKRIPVENRPKITWIIYNQQCEFDETLLSSDAWTIKNVQIVENVLMELIGWK